MKLKLISLLTITATLLAGKVPTTGPVNISMSPAAWDIKYSKGTGSKPKADGAGWLIDMPTDPGQLGYVVQSVAGYLPVSTATATATLEATVVIEASPDCIFDFHTNPDNTGNWPSSARFYIENDGSNADYVRWWATGSNCIILADGTFQYTVPLDPAQWSDTFGRNGASSPEATAGWNAAMANVRRIGFTFGGGSFYGHGVRLLAGTAQFRCQSFGYRVTTN